MIAQKIARKIIRTLLCCITMYKNYVHLYEQFLQMNYRFL